MNYVDAQPSFMISITFQYAITHLSYVSFLKGNKNKLDRNLLKMQGMAAFLCFLCAGLAIFASNKTQCCVFCSKSNCHTLSLSLSL